MGKQNAFMDPFLTWSQSGSQAGDVAAASPQVALTDQEKFRAASGAALGAELSLLVLRQHLTTLAFTQMLSVTTALMAIVASRTAAEAAGRQPEPQRRTVLS